MKTREEIKEKIECKFDEMIYYVINLQNLTNELTNQKKIMILKNKELQQKIDKATEYIKSINCYGMRSGKVLLQKYLYDLLNILNGSDDNE